jgi:hypothetical protein
VEKTPNNKEIEDILPETFIQTKDTLSTPPKCDDVETEMPGIGLW